MAEDSVTELAKLFKQRENKDVLSVSVGEVVAPFPNIQIKLNEMIVLDREDLVFAAHLLSGYQRDLIFKKEEWGETTTVDNHKHRIKSSESSTKIEFVDSLQTGDEVILLPNQSTGVFFVVDKAVRT